MDVDGFIETKDLSKVYTFGTVQVAALRSVTLSLARGRLVGVTGASGSGKSTLVNLLGGLDRPSSGSIRVDVVSQGGVAQTPVLTNGTAVVRFAGMPGAAYDVQRASAVEGPYATIWTTNAPADGLFIYVDDPAPSPSAFYRLMAH